jgi:hypothetical protein
LQAAGRVGAPLKFQGFGAQGYRSERKQASRGSLMAHLLLFARRLCCRSKIRVLKISGEKDWHLFHFAGTHFRDNLQGLVKIWYKYMYIIFYKFLRCLEKSDASV